MGPSYLETEGVHLPKGGLQPTVSHVSREVAGSNLNASQCFTMKSPLNTTFEILAGVLLTLIMGEMINLKTWSDICLQRVVVVQATYVLQANSF